MEEAITGCILGTAIGDALGLPYEGISPQRQKRLVRELNGYHFLFGRGMVSDDTEHTCMTVQALIVSGGDPELFVKSLARQMRYWLLGVPAGIGLATLRATIRLWCGVSPCKSGVFSAGNGAAMRSAIIGGYYGNDLPRLKELVRASTRLTHTDPKAEYGALAIAIAAHHASTLIEIDVAGYIEQVKTVCGSGAEEFVALIERAAESATAEETTESFAVSLGLLHGVSGYIYHTVPVVLHTWFRYPRDFMDAMRAVISAGGDTDTTAAILGGIVGAGVGVKGLPQPLIEGLSEFPKSVAWMRKVGGRLAESLSQSSPQKAVSYFVPAILLRNLIFLFVVLAHGFRRLLPPY